MRRWKNPISRSANTAEMGNTRATRSGGLPVLLVIAAVFLFGVGGIGWLAIRSVAQQDLKSLANHIQIDAYRASVLEWQAFAAGGVSPSLQKAQTAIDAVLRQQTEQLAPNGPVQDIASLFAAYDNDLELEFAALKGGRPTRAQLIQDRAKVSFDKLAKATDAASTYYDSAADRALIQAVAGSALILLVGAVVVAMTNRKSHRARARASARFEHQASHDALTGLPNRVLLTDRLQQLLLLKTRTGAETALLLMDVDRFKDVNDTLGHNCGDELLIKVGDRLRAAVREVDTVARLGGDEFAIVMPGVAGIDAALTVADRVQAALNESFEIEGLDLDVEASMGVVVSGRDGEDVLTLFRHADVAMYAAKKRGSTVAIYERQADESSPVRLTLLRELRQAIDSSNLVLHYQPQLSIETGEIVGVEALVRWSHPERGMIPPDQFIPLAEHSGLIGPLTRYVLNMALAQARSWIDAGTPLPVAVNLSARNLGEDRLLEQVAELLRAHDVPADQLTLEITESAIVTEPERARELLSQLYEMGVKLSIDDFGTGYTSLAQLKNMPIEELKIDRSFVATMTTDSGNAHIVRGVVALGHNLGLSMVAEGVEDDETLRALKDLGCDVVQGYLLARPMASQDLDGWYSGYQSDIRARKATVRAAS